MLVSALRLVGAEHPDTLSEMLVLDRVLLLRRQYSEAEGLLRQTLASYEKIDPDDWHPYYCQAVLGASLARQKTYAEAEPLLAGGWESIRRHEGDLAITKGCRP
jgi:hypothetical protein